MLQLVSLSMFFLQLVSTFLLLAALGHVLAAVGLPLHFVVAVGHVLVELIFSGCP